MGDLIRHGACGVLVRDGKVLLGLRDSSARSHHGQWDVTGGHRESGETDEQTMVRELREELGVVPTRYERVGVLAEDSAGSDYRVAVFAVWDWDGTPTNCSPEHARIAWFSSDELTKLDLASPRLLPLLSQVASELPSL